MNAKVVIASGIIASLVIAMLEMMMEALIPDGAGFFGPPIAIGATVIRDLQGSANPIPFDAAALGIGLMGHMMNSVILAAVFGILVRGRSLSTGGLMAAGMGLGIAVFLGMWLIVVPLVDPLVGNLSPAVFAIGHLMWGIALGLTWAVLSGSRDNLRQAI